MNNHILIFYTKELDKLKQEESYTVKHFNVSYLINLCMGYKEEGKLNSDEYLMLLCKSREVLNA